MKNTTLLLLLTLTFLTLKTYADLSNESVRFLVQSVVSQPTREGKLRLGQEVMIRLMAQNPNSDDLKMLWPKIVGWCSEGPNSEKCLESLEKLARRALEKDGYSRYIEMALELNTVGADLITQPTFIKILPQLTSNVGLKVQALNALGDIEQKKMSYPKALEYLDQANTLLAANVTLPKYLTDWNHGARIRSYVEAGDFEAATKALQAEVDVKRLDCSDGIVNPSLGLYRMDQISLLFAKKEWDAAATLVKSCGNTVKKNAPPGARKWLDITYGTVIGRTDMKAGLAAVESFLAQTPPSAVVDRLVYRVAKACIYFANSATKDGKAQLKLGREELAKADKALYSPIYNKLLSVLESAADGKGDTSQEQLGFHSKWMACF